MTALVYILLCLIWGSTWMGIKIGLQEAPPFYTAALRFALSVVILGTIAAIRGYRFPRSLSMLLRLGYPGLYMFGFSYALVYLAEQRIDSSLMAVLFGSFPFFVAVLSKLQFKHEILPPRIWLGLLVGFAGVVLISFQQWQMSDNLFAGTILAIAGVFAAAHGLVIHKKNFSQENIVVASCVQMIYGGLPLAFAAMVFEDFSDFKINALSVGSIIYLAVFGSVIAFLGYFWLLRRTTALVVSLISFVTPLVAIVIGVFFFDESLSSMTGLGTVLILSGILAVVRRPAHKRAIPDPI